MEAAQFKKIDALNADAWKQRYADLKLLKEKAEQALQLAEKYSYSRGAAYATLNMAVSHFLKSENKSALELCFKATGYFNEHPEEPGFAATFTYMGNIYESFGEYERALEHCRNALQAAQDTGYKEGIGEAHSLLGLIYSRLSDHDRALSAYQEGLRIRQELGDTKAVASSLNRIARSYTLKKEYEKALDHYMQSLKIREDLDDRGVISWTYLGLATTYQDMGELEKAEDYYSRILDDFGYRLDNRCKLQALLGRGQTFYQMNKGEEALVSFHDALELAGKLEAKPLQAEANHALADYYESKGDFRKALDHYRKYRRIREEILNDDTRNRLNNQQIAYAVEKSEKEKEISRLRNVELKSALDQITESIHYAGRIQAALLPQHENLQSVFDDHFVLLLPRDVVSGDFYWCTNLDRDIIFSAADCTGHGVPGALMSMLGISFLNEIVAEQKHTDPGEVLGILRQEVIKALKQSGREDEQKEGMDMALCSYNTESRLLQFAGAYNPLYLIRDGILHVYKADRMPISYSFDLSEPFRKTSIQLRKGDRLYLFSDGFADQFGGPGRKKYKYKPFQEFLVKIHQKPMGKQKELLQQEFLRWKGELEQYDDVLILGIRI